MRRSPRTRLGAFAICGSAVWLANGTPAFAQTGQQVPNFIDVRPLPQTDKARADEAEAKRKADEELRRLSHEAEIKRRADEEARRFAAEAEARRRAEEATRRLTQEVEAKRRADEDAKRVAAEAEAKRRADEDVKRVAAEVEAKRRADEEAKRVAAEAKRRADEARRVAEEAEARLRAEEETKRAAAAADARRRAAEEEAAKRAAAAAAALAVAPTQDLPRLLARGKQLVAEGDINGARLALERAAILGDAEAAVALADTFDAAALRRAGVVGVNADPNLAAFWRDKAERLGGGSKRAPDSPPEPPRVGATPQPGGTTASSAIGGVPSPSPVVAAPPISPEGQRYLARGRAQLKTGDVDAARLFFERAVSEGAAEGALELGATYDPVVLRELGVIGLQPDQARAITLYRQAQQMGSALAAERLRRLGQ